MLWLLHTASRRQVNCVFNCRISEQREIEKMATSSGLVSGDDFWHVFSSFRMMARLERSTHYKAVNFDVKRNNRVYSFDSELLIMVRNNLDTLLIYYSVVDLFEEKKNTWETRNIHGRNGIKWITFAYDYIRTGKCKFVVCCQVFDIDMY